MVEYELMVSRQRKLMLFLLVFIAIGLAFPSLRKLLLGLLLGGTVSFFNMALLQKRVQVFSEAISGNGRIASLGFFTRLLTTVLTVFLALNFKDKVHIGAVIVGLMISYVVMVIDVFIHSAIDVRKQEKSYHDQMNDGNTK